MASLHDFIAVSRRRAKLENERLVSLLDRSTEVLSPLSDPLADDFGAHRWLQAKREEAYSDWLAWILFRIRTPDRILAALNGEVQTEASSQQPATVVREYWVESGHVDRTGRVDIHLKFQNQAVFWIEVKLTSAEDADMEKNSGYRAAQDARPELIKRRFTIAKGGRQKDYSGFEFRSWETVCRGLRSAALGMIRTAESERTGCSRHTSGDTASVNTAAMTLGFVGAIEQNILGFPASLRRRALDGTTIWPGAEIADYLDSWLSMIKETIDA